MFFIYFLIQTDTLPSLQQNLPVLTSKIKELGLGVISFTRHNYEDVKDSFVGCDVVLDGAYQQAEKETQRRLLGSKNQRIICCFCGIRFRIPGLQRCRKFCMQTGRKPGIRRSRLLHKIL